ncbi:hypothetical protein [Pelagovum pacificum]|uniref:hypothetical protein n=1 Tax=Pelagovum pacificum TaxID=2588711 RepID=UPI0018CD8E12|nr:hypothetical protein [Pelagovum pacificum]QQA43568.1 hypothetical protein I8N54_03035 [Pelagovum pacificum]
MTLTAQTPYDMAEVNRILGAPRAAANLFGYVRDGLLRDAGCGLMTASLYDLDEMRSRRVYSDDPESYPAGNFKRLDRNRYYETVIEGAQPFFSTKIEEIAEVFFDWEKIESLGFGSNLNLPAVADGRVVGTINLLEKTGHYTPDRVEAAMAWQPLATVCFLLLHAGDVETDSFIDGPPSSSGATVVEGAEDQKARAT